MIVSGSSFFYVSTTDPPVSLLENGSVQISRNPVTSTPVFTFSPRWNLLGPVVYKPWI